MKKKPAKTGTAKKPAPPWAPVPVAVQIRQHQAALKAAKTRAARAAAAKKHPAAAAKPIAKKTVKRKLALGEAVACCAAEALAASLRLTGWPVSDRDVLALYELTAGDEDEGATIEATLEAARLRGWPDGTRTRKLRSQAVSASARLLGHTAPDSYPAPGHPFRQGSALILGLELPEGPHAVLDDGAAWWSWGQPFDPASFPGAVIEEAWEIMWPS